jgi:nucleotide-binding universal stress UspA family protein
MAQFRKILVPIDFSPHSAAALETAVSIAKAFGSSIHALHCYPINPGGITPYGIMMPPNLDEEIREAANQKLTEWLGRVDAPGITIVPALTSMFPSESIARTAEEIGADLIVMGTRGLTGFKHVVLGSVAERTIRIAPCPVLTVKGPEES